MDTHPRPALVAESVFCACYLLFMACATSAFCMASMRPDSSFARSCACASGLLLAGDAFHLIPRIVYNRGDVAGRDVGTRRTALLGLGNLVSSLTMTGFYLALYQALACRQTYAAALVPESCDLVWRVLLVLSVVRIALCLFPQNRWLTGGSRTWAIARNVPFTLMGITTVYYLVAFYGLFSMALLVSLSFACYLGTVLFAHERPALGMLMIPKTVCYVAIVCQLLSMLR